MDLFTKKEIKDKEFRNRIVVPPMASSTATEEGEVTEETIEHYRDISKDPALTIVEHSFVMEEGRFSSNQLGIHNSELIDGLKKLSSTIKENGSVSCIQINHAGKRDIDDISKKSVNNLDKKELESIKHCFIEASKRAEKAGFEAIEVHGAHSFLLNTFLSPLINKRADKYGESLENRLRYPLEIVEEINEVLDDTLLLFRLGATDLDPNGLDVRDSKLIAKELTKKGVDLIDVSGGICGSRPKKLEKKEGYFIKTASEIKEAINEPVIGVGGIKSPKKAAQFIKEGQVDFVAIGREMLKNPQWVREARKELN